MSILTFLVVASVVYLCAVADPTDEAPADSTDVASSTVSDQERLNKFMADVEKCFENDISPMLSKMSKEDYECMKTSTMDGIGSFINNVMNSRAGQQNGLPKAAQDDYILLQYVQDNSQPAIACKQAVVNQNNCNSKE